MFVAPEPSSLDWKLSNVGALMIRIGLGVDYTIIIIRSPSPPKKKKTN